MLLIIAYGNSLRRDDGAGLALAERLEALCRARGLAVERQAVHQLLPELAPEIARPQVTAVIFVDTRLADPADPAPELEFSPLEADPTSPSVGHHLDPAALLLYADHLYGHRPPAWRLTIPGVDFDHGEGFSPRTARLLAGAEAVLVRVVDATAPKG